MTADPQDAAMRAMFGDALKLTEEAVAEQIEQQNYTESDADAILNAAALNIVQITDLGDARDTAKMIYTLGIAQGKLQGAQSTLAAMSPEIT